MAWNEPGGGNRGDKDPWGNRDDEGPPDLDEAFRKLQQNLSQMFGGGSSSGSGGSGSSQPINTTLIGLAAAVLLIMAGYASGRLLSPKPPDIEQLQAGAYNYYTSTVRNSSKRELDLAITG